MLSPGLFQRSKIQTKKLVHDYVREVRHCIEILARGDGAARPDNAATEEDSRRLFGDLRQILGRTTLVLQGGAMLSMCHLGVVKALHRRRLLPRIITATGTGALVAAIIASNPDERLLLALEGHSINVSAFARSRKRRSDSETRLAFVPGWIRTTMRRITRFIRTGHFFDIDVLTQCVRDNIGDITFEEAFVKSGRILNITIAKPGVAGTPQLLNYLTAPHVVVWSAVAASVATSKQMFATATLKCKNDVGLIEPYFAVEAFSASATRRPTANPRIPMERIGELFDVNHYIVSQTRPYVIPFIRLREFMSQDPILGAVIRVIYSEVLHRLETLDRLGLVPTFVQRIVIDECIPSTSTWSKFTIIPEIRFLDYFRIFGFPTVKAIDGWAMRGEKSVWPKVCQIKIRCCVEVELDAIGLQEHNRCQTHKNHAPPTMVNGHG